MNKEFWKATGIRAARTFLQVILAVWTAGQLITDVDWKFVLLSATSSAVYSILTSILTGLPEAKYAEHYQEHIYMSVAEPKDSEVIEDDE